MSLEPSLPPMEPSSLEDRAFARIAFAGYVVEWYDPYDGERTEDWYETASHFNAIGFDYVPTLEEFMYVFKRFDMKIRQVRNSAGLELFSRAEQFDAELPMFEQLRINREKQEKLDHQRQRYIFSRRDQQLY